MRARRRTGVGRCRRHRSKTTVPRKRAGSPGRHGSLSPSSEPPYYTGGEAEHAGRAGGREPLRAPRGDRTSSSSAARRGTASASSWAGGEGRVQSDAGLHGPNLANLAPEQADAITAAVRQATEGTATT